MRRAYEKWKPAADAIEVVSQANAILTSPEYAAYNLTLRQLYYQFVARALIPNTERSYKRLGDIVSKARLAGMIDWRHITDTGRTLAGTGFTDDNPADLISTLPHQFFVDPWTTQPRRIEVWVEKDALANVIGRAAGTYYADYFACRGYVSSSAMHRAGQRLGDYLAGGQAVTILHLGDHDPSGIDMTRDIRERLEQFIYTDYMIDEMGGGFSSYAGIEQHMLRTHKAYYPDAEDDGRDIFEVKRIALNMDQVRQYNPPPNPAKMSDARAAGYVEQYGYESWELDALPPAVLDALITAEIEDVLDRDAFDERLDLSRTERRRLQILADRWDDVSDYLDDLED